MILFLSVLFGLVVGSFANVCILRLPDDKSIRTPRSFCPHCQRTLKAWHNIPVLSFLLLRGRCAYCRTPISWQYPLVEALMAFLFVGHALIFQGSIARMLVADILGFYLFTISVIDYRHRIIPDELSLSLAAIGLAGSWANPFLMGFPGTKCLQSIAAGVGGGFLMFLLAWAGEKVFKKEALGGGDIKLVAGSGAVLGWQGVLGPLLFGSLTGGFVALVLLLLKKKKLGESLPFGPFLSFGAYLACLFPGLLPALVNPGFKPLNFP